MVRFFYVKYAKMLSFFLVAEALTGLIYHRPPGENSSFHLPLRSRHSPEQDFLRSTCTLCLKAVFPHFLHWSTSLPIVPSYLALDWKWRLMHATWIFLSNQMADRWVSFSIHMKQTQQCDWNLGSWIINGVWEMNDELWWYRETFQESVVRRYPDVAIVSTSLSALFLHAENLAGALLNCGWYQACPNFRSERDGNQNWSRIFNLERLKRGVLMTLCQWNFKKGVNFVSKEQFFFAKILSWNSVQRVSLGH